MASFEDDDKSIFSTSLSSEEKDAVHSGEERGKREAMKADPERFGMARQRALGKERYDANYVRIFGHD